MLYRVSPKIEFATTFASAVGMFRILRTRRSRKLSDSSLAFARVRTRSKRQTRGMTQWRVWEEKKLPAGKILIPGVVTHHTMTVEHPRLVADRILRFARIVGRENVIAGTDCGFAQAQFIQRAAPSVMWAKFESLVEGARIASAELWQKGKSAQPS